MNANASILPFGKTNWLEACRITHRALVDHCHVCKLCSPNGGDGTPGASIHTACVDGVLMFSEWLSALNQRVLEVPASDVVSALDTVFAESRGE